MNAVPSGSLDSGQKFGQMLTAPGETGKFAQFKVLSDASLGRPGQGWHLEIANAARGCPSPDTGALCPGGGTSPVKPAQCIPQTLPAAKASLFISEPFHLYFPQMAPVCWSGGILTSLGPWL